MENFLESKEIIFLKNISKSKLDVTWVLVELDRLVSTFESSAKDKLKCSNVEITSDYKVNMKCEALSAWYDKYIKWFNWNTDSYVWWTSISYANSFLNFLKIEPSKFVILSEPKTFNSSKLLLNKDWFTDKTNFDLELQYNPDNNLLTF
jgi:hypothetical protein